MERKSTQGQKVSTTFGGHFGDFSKHLGRSFFDVFCGRPFFAPGRHLGAQGGRKGTKREPKVMKKEVRRHLVEHAKTMAGTVREAYGEVPGRARDTLLSARGAKARLLGSREGSKRIFHDLGCPLGIPWGVIWGEEVCLFRGLILRRLLGDFGEGPAAGVWSL